MIWRKRRESDLERELRFHLEERAADLMARGATREEAVRRARIELGGVEQVREGCRDVRPFHWLERVFGETILAIRGMRRNPLSTLAVVLTIAVCVAVNTAVFTVVDSLLLRPLPFADADQLITMENLYPRAGVTEQDGGAASGDLFDRTGQMPAVAEHALYRYFAFPVDRGGVPVQVRGIGVSPGFLPLLRVRPSEGRLFQSDESDPGKGNVVMLTAGFARELFGDQPATGKTIRLGNCECLIVGVLPASFRFVTPEIQYLIPLALGVNEKRSRHSNNYGYVARLRPGATIAQAQSQLDAINARITESLPELRELLTNAGFYTRVSPLQDWLMRHVRPSLQLLWVGAALVLVIGAVNVAGLSLARASARVRETATRVALGGTRRDIVVHCLLESLLPATVGAGLGAAGGWLALGALNSSLLPGAAAIEMSGVVVAYACAGALCSGIAAGLAAAMPARRLQLSAAIADGGRGGTSRLSFSRRLLVVVQIGLAFVLFNGAALLTATLRELGRVNPGYRLTEVMTASTYANSAGFQVSIERARSAMAAIPGVGSVSAGSEAPLSAGFDDNVVMAEGYTMKQGESAISPIRLHVMPGYFETLGIRLVSGRTFDERDSEQSPAVVVVDERLAQRFWPGQNAVGRKLYYPGQAQNLLLVVGVVGSARMQNLDGKGNPNGTYYVAWKQASTRRVTFVWRGNAGTVEAVRREFARNVPGAALFDIRSMTERQELTLASRQAAHSLAMVFAFVAVLLAAIGIHGLLAFFVEQRRREIGIRMAIGCEPRGIFAMFLRDGLVLTAFGLAAGAALSMALRDRIAGQLYGVGAMEPAVVALSMTAIVIVAGVSAAAPAWRAARLDPVRVLGEG